MIEPTGHDNEEQDEEDLITPDDDNADQSEVDPDEAIHQKPDKSSEESMQYDGDDAVHKAYKPAADPLHENQERDPDDRAHGRI